MIILRIGGYNGFADGPIRQDFKRDYCATDIPAALKSFDPYKLVDSVGPNGIRVYQIAVYEYGRWRLADDDPEVLPVINRDGTLVADVGSREYTDSNIVKMD